VESDDKSLVMVSNRLKVELQIVDDHGLRVEFDDQKLVMVRNNEFFYEQLSDYSD
jgi:hypothetical protein